MAKLTMIEWRGVFQEQIQEEKPNHDWSLKMDQQLGNSEAGWKQVLQEHAHARFRCSQCYHSWSSHQVFILFLMRFEQSQRQGWVRMRVFRQQCDNCASGKYEEPQFTEMDVSRIIRHLILDIREKCYKEHVDRSELSEVIWEHTGPHKYQRCEAFKLGFHKSHHGGAKGSGHHGKAQRPGLPQSSEEIIIPAKASKDCWDSVACFGCFCLIMISIFIFIAYLSGL
ncbi:receptor-transporting protein 2-like [Sphaerodactylus townsendi]|uniref:receptor-transporting protein 2-like n=1 Tax=Sphaerodactylus townsendi TaxID=933632 RepID=UPI002025B8E5|nr:receptor-transporting protein 2-like [Sphaerodactylus townsendi]